MINAKASSPGAPDQWRVIALLDDDHAFREALANGMSSFGYDVVALASAEALFEFLPSPRVACLVLDYDLPGQNGLEVQAALVELEATIPVIFLSACLDERVSRAALTAGAVAFLTKPTPLHELERIISELIHENREMA